MTPWLSLAISLVAITIATIILRRMVARRMRSDIVLEDLRREVGAILTEMNQTTERNIEIIEDRITALQSILEQADRKLGVLKRETSRESSAEIVYSHLARNRLMVEDTSPGEADATPRPEPPPAAPAETADSGATAEPTVKERVMSLYRQGISVDRIASRLGTAVSEVELIVSLGERR